MVTLTKQFTYFRRYFSEESTALTTLITQQTVVESFLLYLYYRQSRSSFDICATCFKLSHDNDIE